MATPKNRLGSAVALLGALGLALAALVLLLDGDAEDVEVELDDEGRPLSDREVAERDRDRLVAEARNEHPGYGLMIRAFEGAGPGAFGSGELDIDEARRIYDAVMDEVERLADRPRRLRQKQWREVYRAANDSFSALSIHLDAKNASQAKELEEAHRRLRQGLASLRVRGGKFKPTRD